MSAPLPPPSPTPSSDRLDNAQVGGTHYSGMKITPWQFLESCLTPEEMRGYLKGEAIVYLARELQKGGVQDVQKAAHVLQKLIEVYPAGALPTERPRLGEVVHQLATGCPGCASQGCRKADACTEPTLPPDGTGS